MRRLAGAAGCGRGRPVPLASAPSPERPRAPPVPTGRTWSLQAVTFAGRGLRQRRRCAAGRLQLLAAWMGHCAGRHLRLQDEPERDSEPRARGGPHPQASATAAAALAVERPCAPACSISCPALCPPHHPLQTTCTWSRPRRRHCILQPLHPPTTRLHPPPTTRRRRRPWPLRRRHRRTTRRRCLQGPRATTGQRPATASWTTSFATWGPTHTSLWSLSTPPRCAQHPAGCCSTRCLASGGRVVLHEACATLCCAGKRML